MNTPFDDDPLLRKPGRFSRLRSSFLTGLVVVTPVALTMWLVWSVIGWIDGVILPLVPQTFQPEAYIGINLRGVGVLFFLLFTVFIGWIAKGWIGRSLIRWGETLVLQMPVVRTIYSGVKQIAETVFNQTERSFEKACLIEYPRRGIWAIGFVSTEAKGEVAERAQTGGPLVGVFVPTTPNPTSGFLLFLPKDDVTELDMTVEQAAKLVISAGLVYPNKKDPTVPTDVDSDQT